MRTRITPNTDIRNTFYAVVYIFEISSDKVVNKGVYLFGVVVRSFQDQSGQNSRVNILKSGFHLTFLSEMFPQNYFNM